MSEANDITLEMIGAVAVITLDRPGSGNALDRTMCESLERISQQLADKGQAVRSILLRATGKNFCVGGDAAYMESAPSLSEGLNDLVTPLHAAVGRLSQLGAPMVVGARGAAAGAGLSLIALSDYAVVAKDAKFVMAYGAIGLTPDGGGSWSLPRQIGIRRAKELALMNRRLLAEEALAWGLVNEVCDAADVDARAMAVAVQLAAGPTAAFAKTLALLKAAADTSLEAHLVEEEAAIIYAGASADAREGVSSLRDRRPATFRGE